jgi:hypothetical protein
VVPAQGGQGVAALRSADEPVGRAADQLIAVTIAGDLGRLRGI